MDTKPDTSQAKFLQLFLDHQDDLRAFIGAIIRDRGRRDDIFQEVSLVLWKSFERFDSTRSFGAWARGIAKNRILNSYRSESRVPLPVAPEAIEATLNAFDTIEAANHHQTDWEDALETCLSRLPSKSRQVLAMRYDADTAIDSMALKLRKTPEAIYKSLSRLRRQLQLCVEERLARPS